jgi:lipopolysaccharide biosynthesis regulator YciM
MKLKHFLFLFASLGLFFVSVYWVTLNHDLLLQSFFFVKGWPVPAWLAMFMFFLAGLFLMGILFLIDAWRKNIRLRILRREKEQKTTVDQALEMAVYFLLQNEEELARQLLEVHEGGPGPSSSARLLEVCLSLRRKDFDKASSVLSQVERESTSPLVDILRSRLAHLTGRYEDAIAILENLARTMSPDLEPAIRKKLRKVYMDAGKWSLALAVQEQILAGAGPAGQSQESDLRTCIQYELAKQMAGEGKEKDAASLLKMLVKDRPAFNSAWVLLGDTLQKLGVEEKALEAYQEGFEATLAGILLHRIEDYYLQRERPEEALAAVNQMRFKVSRDIIPRFFLGRLYYRLEMLEEAYRFLSNLKSLAPHSAALNYILGSIEDRLGKGSLAAASYRKAASDSPSILHEYWCFSCQTPHKTWYDRCPHCKAWNSVEINFKEEVAEGDQLGLKISPIANPLF